MAVDVPEPVLQQALPMAIEGILWRSQSHLQCSLAIADCWPTFQVQRRGWPAPTRTAFPRHLEDVALAEWPETAPAHWQAPEAHAFAVDACRFHYHQHLLFLGSLRQVSMVCKSWYTAAAKWIPTPSQLPEGPEFRPGDPSNSPLPAVPRVVHSTYPFRLELFRGLGGFDSRLTSRLPEGPELELSSKERTILQTLLTVASAAPGPEDDRDSEIGNANPPGTEPVRRLVIDWDHVELLTVIRIVEFTGAQDRRPVGPWRLVRLHLDPADIESAVCCHWFRLSDPIQKFLSIQNSPTYD